LNTPTHKKRHKNNEKNNIIVWIHHAVFDPVLCHTGGISIKTHHRKTTPNYRPDLVAEKNQGDPDNEIEEQLAKIGNLDTIINDGLPPQADTIQSIDKQTMLSLIYSDVIRLANKLMISP